MGNTSLFGVPEFQAKFGVSVPLFVQWEWTETVAERRWFVRTIKHIARAGAVLKASAVEVSTSYDGGEFELHVVYRKAGDTRALVMPVGGKYTLLQRSPEEWTIRFSDGRIREKLEAELGVLPPRRGNFVCSTCAMDTGDSEACLCGSPSYWVPGGGGCRLSYEAVIEWE